MDHEIASIVWWPWYWLSAWMLSWSLKAATRTSRWVVQYWRPCCQRNLSCSYCVWLLLLSIFKKAFMPTISIMVARRYTRFQCKIQKSWDENLIHRMKEETQLAYSDIITLCMVIYEGRWLVCSSCTHCCEPVGGVISAQLPVHKTRR